MAFFVMLKCWFDCMNTKNLISFGRNSIDIAKIFMGMICMVNNDSKEGWSFANELCGNYVISL